MFNYGINNALYCQFSTVNEECREQLLKDAENVADCLENGLFAIGQMMSDLGGMANEKNGYSDQAISNETAAKLGEHLQAIAYLLGAFKELQP